MQRHEMIKAFAQLGLKGMAGAFDEAVTTDEKGRPSFNSVVSIERDVFSHQTLLLRHFIRQFPEGEAPDDYYAFLAGAITREELYLCRCRRRGRCCDAREGRRRRAGIARAPH